MDDITDVDDISEDEDLFYENKKKNNKGFVITKRIIIFLCIILVIGITAILFVRFHGIVYKSYSIKKTITRQDSNTVLYTDYDGKLLKYSSDGISIIDSDGSSSYNASFDMTNPKVDICGKYIMVADIGNKTAYVFNGSDSGKLISTDYEIVQAVVSSHGIAAILTQDKSSNEIDIYNPYDISDTLLAQIPTNVEDGYPVSVDISPDSQSLTAAYVTMDSSEIKSRISFYNFSDVGKNTNCLVGVKEYSDRLITDVEYMSSSTMVAFADTGFTIWNDMKAPEEKFEKKVSGKMKSIVYNKNYVGYILDNDGQKKYEMDLYTDTGHQVVSEKFKTDYDTVKLYNDEMIMTSDNGCVIYRVNGTFKYSMTSDDKINCFMPTSKGNRYFWLDDNNIKIIKLTL